MQTNSRAIKTLLVAYRDKECDKPKTLSQLVLCWQPLIVKTLRRLPEVVGADLEELQQEISSELLLQLQGFNRYSTKEQFEKLVVDIVLAVAARVAADDDDNQQMLARLEKDAPLEPWEVADAMQLSEDLSGVLSRVLTARQRLVIVHRFGIGLEDSETLDAVGQRLGLGSERTRQIERAACRKLMGMGNILGSHLTGLEDWWPGPYLEMYGPPLVR